MFFYASSANPLGGSSSSDDDGDVRAGRAGPRSETSAGPAADDLVRGVTVRLRPAPTGGGVRLEIHLERDEPPRRAPRRRDAETEEKVAAAQAAAAEGRACTICFDLGLGADMGDAEAKALANQLALAYGYNKRLAKPLALALAGLDAAAARPGAGRLAVCDALLGWGWERWQLRREAGPPWAAFDRLVYLTADAPHVLTELRPDTTYVLGGLVDHTPKPGVALRAAEDAGVATARLPLEGIVTVRKPALTCLACFQILAGWQRCRDWRRAVREAPAMHCAPMRKYVVWKDEEGRAAQEAPRPLRIA